MEKMRATEVPRGISFRTINRNGNLYAEASIPGQQAIIDAINRQTEMLGCKLEMLAGQLKKVALRFATPHHDPIDLSASMSSDRTSNPRGKLTEAERQHRKENNLCINCGDPYHMIAKCPLLARHIFLAASNEAQDIVSRSSQEQAMHWELRLSPAAPSTPGQHSAALSAPQTPEVRK